MNNNNNNNQFWGGFSSPTSTEEELGNPQLNNCDGTLIVPSPTNYNNNPPPMTTGFDWGGGYPPPPPTQQSTTAKKSEVNNPAKSRKHVTFQQPLCNPYIKYNRQKKKQPVEEMKVSINQSTFTSATIKNNTFGDETPGINQPSGANAQIERNNWPQEGPKSLGDTMYPPETSEKSQAKKGGIGHRLSTDSTDWSALYGSRWNRAKTTHQFINGRGNQPQIDHQHNKYEIREVEALKYYGSCHELLKLQIQTDVQNCFAVCQAVKTPYIYWMLFDGEKFTGLRMGHLSDDIVCPPDVGKWYKIKYSFNAEDTGRIFVREIKAILPIIPTRLHGKQNIQFLLEASKQPDSLNYRTILGEIKLPENFSAQNQLYVWVSLVWPPKDERRALSCEEFSPIALKFEDLSTAQEADEFVVYEHSQTKFSLSSRQLTPRQADKDEEGEEVEVENECPSPLVSSSESNTQNQVDEQTPVITANSRQSSSNFQPINNLGRRELFGFGLYYEGTDPQESGPDQLLDESEAKKMKRVICKMPKYLHPIGREVQIILHEWDVLVESHPEEDPREVFSMQGPAGALNRLIEHYKWACGGHFHLIEELDVSEQPKPDMKMPFACYFGKGFMKNNNSTFGEANSNGGSEQQLSRANDNILNTSLVSEIAQLLVNSPALSSEIGRILVDSPDFLEQIKQAVFGSCSSSQLPQNLPDILMIPPSGTYKMEK